MMRIRIAFLVVVALACGDLTSASGQPRLAVNYQRTPMTDGLAPDSATITSVAGQVSIDGKMLAGDPCRVIKGALVVSGNQIQITMRADSDGKALCLAAVA